MYELGSWIKRLFFFFSLENSKTLGSLHSFYVHFTEWEIESGFNPKNVRQEPAWVTIPSLTIHIGSKILNQSSFKEQADYSS